MTRFFETTKVPTSHIFQNHLDEIHYTIDTFCKTHKKFTWHIGDGSRGKVISTTAKIQSYLLDKTPKHIKYAVVAGDEVLYFEIKDGVVINVKNGSFELYGLYQSLVNVFSQFRVPAPIAFSRRYWVFIVPFLLICSTVLLSNTPFRGWAWISGIIAALFIFGVLAVFINTVDDEDFELSSYILDTKISYRTYSNKLGLPLNAMLTSMSSVVTFLAGIATIVSTILFFVTK